jgi:hypothetical protein
MYCGDRIETLRKIKRELIEVSLSLPGEYRPHLSDAFNCTEKSIKSVLAGFKTGEIAPTEWEHKYTGG